MNTRAVTYIACGQICFAFFLVVCVALHPGFVLKANEGGISNYGIHIKTVVPYTLALGLAGFFSHRAAGLFTSEHTSVRHFGLLLRVYSWLLLAMLLTTYTYALDTTLKDLHIATGVMIILFETVASVWMYQLLKRPRWDGALLGVELFGFVLAAVTFLGGLHVLFVAQLLTGASFALLLVHTGQRLAALAPES